MDLFKFRSNMALWWWVLVPYSLTFEILVRTFKPDGPFLVHILGIFLILDVLAVIGTIVWILVALRRLFLERRIGFGETAMLVLGTVSVVIGFHWLHY